MIIVIERSLLTAAEQGGLMAKKALRSMMLVSMVLITSMLITGCGDSFPYPSNQTARATEKLSQSPLKPVTIKLYFMNDKRSATDEVWKQIGERFKDTLNAEFDVDFIPVSDYANKLLVMYAAGHKWDANYDGAWIAYNQMVAKGAYLPVNDLLQSYAPHLYSDLNNLGVLKSVTVNGQIMAIPWTLRGNMHPYFVWRADLVEKAGMPPIPENSIKTIEQADAAIDAMHAAMPYIKMAIPDLNNIAGGSMDWYYLRDEYQRMDFHGLTFSLNDPDCTIIPLEKAPFFRESLKRVRTQYEKGLIAKDAMVDKTESSQYWNNGSIPWTSTTHEWVYAIPAFTDPNARIGKSQLYPGNKFYNRSATGNLMAINKNSPNPERTMMFFELLETNRELYDMVMYGIEGKTYELDGEMAKYPEGMSLATSNYMDWGGQWALWKLQFMRPTETYSQGFWGREAEFAGTPNHIPSPIDSLYFDQSTIKNELSQRDQILKELGTPLICGVVEDVDQAVDELIEKLDAIGTQKICDELNRQVKEFLSHQ